MTKAEARAVLAGHSFSPGDSTRGMVPEARQAVKAALTRLAQPPEKKRAPAPAAPTKTPRGPEACKTRSRGRKKKVTLG